MERPEADARTWSLYGEALLAQRRPAEAAAAFAKAVALEPNDRQARLRGACALAAAGDAEALYAQVRALLFREPLLAVDILESREVRPFLSEPRFQELHQAARAQALD